MDRYDILYYMTGIGLIVVWVSLYLQEGFVPIPHICMIIVGVGDSIFYLYDRTKGKKKYLNDPENNENLKNKM